MASPRIEYIEVAQNLEMEDESFKPDRLVLKP